MSNEEQAIHTRPAETGSKSHNKKEDMPIFTYASIDLDNSTYSHRCFMTGESCSMQEGIASGRRELHGKKNSINAFVVMSFSKVTDVVYKWRIKPFVESLQKNLYFNHSHTRLYCFSPKQPSAPVLDEIIGKEPFSRKEYLDLLDYFEKSIPKNLLEKIKAIIRKSEKELFCLRDLLSLAEDTELKKIIINPEIKKALFASSSPKEKTAIIDRITDLETAFFSELSGESKKAIIEIIEKTDKKTEKTILYGDLSKEGKKDCINNLPDVEKNDLFDDLPIVKYSVYNVIADNEKITQFKSDYDKELSNLMFALIEQFLRKTLREAISNQLTRGKPNTVFFEPVKTVNVIRADSNPSLNYVICNRICQQLQLADLVIVDVSVENANVFYELGMAVALGKLVLPICYSENYFKQSDASLSRIAINPDIEHHIENFRWRRALFEHFCIRFRNTMYSEDIKAEIYKRRSNLQRRKAETEKKTVHIDPDLMDRIIVKDADVDDTVPRKWETRYLPFIVAKDPKNAFSDSKYDRQPYLEPYNLPLPNGDVYYSGDPFELHKIPEDLSQTHNTPENLDANITVGEYLYKKLLISYNYSTCKENTLVVYTLDAFLNEDQAPQCMINYYHAVVRQFKDSKCFRGERVGVLLHSTNVVPDDAKDAPEGTKHFYRVGDIIQIGVNQATYRAHMEMIKPNTFMTLTKTVKTDETKKNKKVDISETVKGIDELENKDEIKKKAKAWHDNSIIFAKQFIRNRAMPIYPCDPVYVKRIKDGLQTDVFHNINLDSTNFPDQEQSDECARYFFCLFHIMLRTLQYTNEIVVDISQNAVQSYFWLGAAHASDVNAITVRREATDQERLAVSGSVEIRDRFIFDVAGLWSAVYRTADPDGFYEQLAKAQSGIEQRSRLLLKRRDIINERLTQSFWDSLPDNAMEKIKDLHDDKEHQEDIELEAYYRNEFWHPLLRYNRLRIYSKETTLNGLSFVSKWDSKATGTISHYLSKKKQIGEYQIKTLKNEESPPSANQLNSQSIICIGGRTASIMEVLINKCNYGMTDRQICTASHAEGQFTCSNTCFKSSGHDSKIKFYKKYRGFVEPACASRKTSEYDNPYDKGFWTQVPAATCYNCLDNLDNKEKRSSEQHANIFESLTKAGNSECLLIGNDSHSLLAQLVLFCDRATKEIPFDRFRVAIFGASGPATSALASVLVDRSLDEEAPSDDPDTFLQSDDSGKVDSKRSFPLSWMQDKIRKTLILKYKEELKKATEALLGKYKDQNTQNSEIWNTDFCRYLKVDKDGNNRESPIEVNQIRKYFDRAADSADYYLSSVLYRYFLPLLSKDDITRICNGMKMYVSSLRAENVSPFALRYNASMYAPYTSKMPAEIINAAAFLVPSVLESLLNSFCGVEVFYEVEVRGGSITADTREIKSIQQTDIPIKCIFRTGKQIDQN